MTLKKGPYQACSTSQEKPPYVWGIQGPGDGLGYHGWYLYPENTFTTLEEAEKAAQMMNLAFLEGKKARSKEIKDLIG